MAFCASDNLARFEDPTVSVKAAEPVLSASALNIPTIVSADNRVAAAKRRSHANPLASVTDVILEQYVNAVEPIVVNVLGRLMLVSPVQL